MKSFARIGAQQIAKAAGMLSWCTMGRLPDILLALGAVSLKSWEVVCMHAPLLFCDAGPRRSASFWQPARRQHAGAEGAGLEDRVSATALARARASVGAALGRSRRVDEGAAPVLLPRAGAPLSTQ